MSTDVREEVQSDELVDLTESRYDRSSLVGEFMVMIPDQTEEEYLRRCPEGKFCELIDGTVYMPSPVTAWHQFEVQFLTLLLQLLCEERQLGIVLTGPAALKLRPDRIVEPDIFILPPGGKGQIRGAYCDTPALVVVEVLSKSNRSYDLKEKAALYREAKVAEVWFVDNQERVLTVLRRTTRGYKTLKLQSGSYRSQALPGFWLDISWLWANPRPNALRCLEAILAGPPA